MIAFLGFRMLFPDQAPAISAEAMREATEKADFSFSPLAMPWLFGPGLIATVISMSSAIRHGEHGTGTVVEHIGVIIGIGAIARIMGFLMIFIGVQFVINGVRELVGG